MTPRWRRWLLGDFSWRRLIRSVLEVYLVLLIFAWFFGDRLIFQPPRSGYGPAPDIHRVPTPDGETLAVLHMPAPGARWTVLHSHGNAEDLRGSRYFGDWFNEQGFSFVAWDYRGYGISTGRSTEAHAYADAETVWKFVTGELGVPPGDIILHGRSLGGALAVDLAARHEVAGLVLESAFVTAFRAATGIPLAPFDRFRNLPRLRQVEAPVMVIHGTRDRVISIRHGRRLHREAPNPVLALWVDGAGHDDILVTDEAAYARAWQEFAERLGAWDQPRGPSLSP